MSRRNLATVIFAVLVGLALATLVFRPQGEAAQAQTELTWRTTGDLSNARGHRTATLLPEGRVLVASGLGPEGTNTSTEVRSDTLLKIAKLFSYAVMIANARATGGEFPGVDADVYEPCAIIWRAVI